MGSRKEGYAHNFERLGGQGVQGAELGILRRYFLRRWSGKMYPAGSDGKMILSSGAVFSQPRLPALNPPDPEPRHGSGQVEEALWIGPGIILNECHPCLFTT